MKNIIKNVNIAIIILIISASGLFIGKPLAEKNIQIVYIILNIYSAIYFIIKTIKKEIIINYKVDILICILTFSTLIPLIFKRYVSLSYTIQNILSFFCILELYLIIKNECKKNPNYINIIINTIIISILILCFIGIDEVNKNYLKQFKEFIGYQHVEYDEVRICSLFAYPNTMAAVSGFGVFLCLGYVFNDNRIRVKILYLIFILIMFYTLILTYSRLVYIIFAIVFIFYCLVVGKKYKIYKKNNKKVLIIFFIIFISVIIYILIGLNIADKISITDKYQKILYSVNPNQEYNFCFNINSISNEVDGVTIKLTEKNKFFDDIHVTKIELGSYIGEKEIKIHTSETTSVMYLNIELKENTNTTLTLKSAKLNNKQFILKYKILPTDLINKIRGIKFNNKSTFERIAFIKDGLELIKDSWIIGNGGNAWENLQYNVQNYNYYAKEAHCFPIKLWLENGIVALCAYVGIIICIINKFYICFKFKPFNMQYISWIIAVVFIQLHSLLDFDMSFFYVQLIVITVLAIVSSKDEQINVINNKFSVILNCIIIIMSFIIIYVFSIQIYYRINTRIIKVNSVWTEEKIFDIYSTLLPFDSNISERRIKVLYNNKSPKIERALKNIILNEKTNDRNTSLFYAEIYIEKILEKIDNKTNEKINFILRYSIETENYSKYRADFQLERFNNLKSIINKLDESNLLEYKNKFENQLYKEIEQKEKYILDYEKARYEKKKVEEYIKRLKMFRLIKENNNDENISTNVSI